MSATVNDVPVGTRVEGVLLRAGAVLTAVVTGGLLVAATGHDPWFAYREMAVGALGSAYAVEQTVLKAIPLLLCALAVSLAFTAGLWNIGAEGQMAVGAIAATWLALASEHLSAAFVLPSLLFLGVLGGAAWATIPGLLRVLFGINEILATLMLNYVGLLLVDYLVFGAWADPAAFTFPYSRPFPTSAHLPAVFGDVHMGLLFALLSAGALWWVLRQTPWGYEVRVMGASARTSRYAGIPVIRNVVIVMALSGGLAGLAGAVEVAGALHRLQQGVSQGYGYVAIIVAWIARLHPLGVVAVAVLMAALLNGGLAIQATGVPAAIAAILQALILTFVLATERLVHRIRWRRAVAITRARGQP
ncbi:MAG: ABC transporter permease [Armatimonadota bacterium]|nr:ABC transporter permease [Armatimonadota bacterium]MDR5698064.1 ABC transporter permease [Armatimonadota bacterium]